MPACSRNSTEWRQPTALALRCRKRRRDETRDKDCGGKEELEFYLHKAPQEWLDALAPLGTDEHKPFLEAAPYLIVIFAQSYSLLPDGRRVKNYYVQESVGIATGILITAIHHAGLVSLPHTPNPMGFLNQLLSRPVQERPFLILVACRGEFVTNTAVLTRAN